MLGIWIRASTFALPSQLWANKGEVPKNGKDDDKNGYVDDVNGTRSRSPDLTPDLLIPAEALGPDAPEQGLREGLEDLQANLDTPDAQATSWSSRACPRIRSAVRGINQYSQYLHGTHVAGITSRGNPACRLLAARVTFDYHLIPENPTIEQAKNDADAMVRTVAYLKQQGVRAVNMSWGGDLKSIDNALEQNGYKGTPEERRAFAHQLYDIQYKALEDAVRNAPNTLSSSPRGTRTTTSSSTRCSPARSSFRTSSSWVLWTRRATRRPSRASARWTCTRTATRWRARFRAAIG